MLGAGIMGASVALYLLRRGHQVTLFDEAPEPMSGASRWNEGKIHLGFLYAADGSLRTAQKLLGGGLAFQRLTEELLDTSIAGVATQSDDLYLVHRKSVVPPDAMAAYFDRVTTLLLEHPGAASYFGGPTRARRLQSDAFAALQTGPEIVAALAAPERSVDTQFVADRFVDALAAQPNLETVFGQRVTHIAINEAKGTERWQVTTGALRHGPFAGVVNALWQSLPGLDEKIGIAGGTDISHRFRVSVFVETDRRFDLPSAVVCAGPFGDVKAYPGGRYYLSWYEHGLLASGAEREPPPTPVLDDARKAAIKSRILQRLSEALPGAANVCNGAISTRVEGGWVLALGGGALDDPRASIHRRDRFGIARRGKYVSVNTGKYSMAPFLAREVALLFD